MNKITEVALEKISFAAIQKYLANNNWVSIASKREHNTLSLYRMKYFLLLSIK